MARQHRPMATPWEITTRLLIVAGLMAVLASVALWNMFGQWNAAAWATLISGAVVTVLCISLNAAWVLRVLVQKKALISLNVVVMVVLAGAILVGANYFFIRHYRRYDATEASRYSLSDRTLNVLRSLPSKVSVYAFFTADPRAYQEFPFGELARDMLVEYQENSNARFQVRFVNAMEDPTGARSLLKDLDVGSIELNSVIFACGEKPSLRTKVVKTYDMTYTDYSGGGMEEDQERRKKFKGEEAFTSAILSVLEEKPAKVCFLSGHGERQIDRYRPDGCSELKEELEKANLKVEKLELHKAGKVPDDCDVLVVAGARSGLQTREVDAIRQYLGRKPGPEAKTRNPSLLVLLEPVIPEKTRESALAPLLKEYNIEAMESCPVIDYTKRIVVTEEGLKAKDTVGFQVVTEDYPEHEVSTGLRGNPAQFFTIACVRPDPKRSNPDYDAQVILAGSKSGWGEMDTRSLFDKGEASPGDEDVPAPVPFGVAAKARNDDGPRVVVVGDSDFITNQVWGDRGNVGVIMNSVLWLARKNTSLGLPPVDVEKEKFQMTRQREKMVEFAALYGLPGAWILFALGVWVFRTIAIQTSDRWGLALRFGILVGLLLAATGIVFYSRGFSTMAVMIPLAVGILLFAAGILRNLPWLRDALRQRQTYYGANVVTMVGLAVLLMAIVNYMALRHYARWDRTDKKLYALSSKTVEELKKVDRPVNTTLLLPGGGAHPVTEHMENILDEFRRCSRRIASKSIVFSRESQEEFQLLQDQLNTSLTREDLPSVIVLSGQNVRHVKMKDVVKRDEEPMDPYGFQRPKPPKLIGEEALLNAVLSVARDEKVTLYFSVGNGERDPEKFDDEDFGEFAKLLKRENYEVKTLKLKDVDSIPSDCDILVLGAPKVTYGDHDLEVIRGHLNRERSLLVMLEPEVISGARSGLEPLLEEYNIRVQESTVVVDVQQQLVGLGPQGPVYEKRPSPTIRVGQFGYHTITEGMEGNMVGFQMACQIDVVETPPDYGNPMGPGGPQKKWNTQWLAKSSEDGWIVRDVKPGTTRVELGANDTKGQGTVAVAVEPANAPAMPSRYGPPQPPQEKRNGPYIVAFGDADFASNAMVRGIPGNESLVKSAVRWLSRQKKADLQIEPKEIDFRKFEFRSAPVAGKAAAWASMFGLPILFLLPALVVWVLRRR